MFYNCNNLNYTILEGILHKISLSKLESMEEMFYGCSTLNSFILEKYNLFGAGKYQWNAIREAP